MPDQSDGAKVAQHGGVVFRVAGELFFLPASIAMQVMPLPEIARVPGGPPELRGVALVGGDMIPVIDVLEQPLVGEPAFGDRSGKAMLVCTVLGECVGLAGIDVVATGRFEAGERAGEVKLRPPSNAPGASPQEQAVTARTFDVAAVIARVREGRWAV